MTEAQVWRDRYFKLRNLINRVSTSRFIDMGVLLLRLDGAKRVKHEAKAQAAHELLREMLLSEAVFFQESQHPGTSRVEITSSAFVVLDRGALMELVKTAGEPYPVIDEATEGDNHG